MRKPGLISWVSGVLLAILLVLIANHGGKSPAKKAPVNLPADAPVKMHTAMLPPGNLPPVPPAKMDTATMRPSANMDTATLPPDVTYWQQKFPQYQLVKWALGFLTGDGQDDAAIIYRTGAKCYLVVVINQPNGGFQVTDPLPAPVSDQQITIRDVNDKNPNEIIVSGQKNRAYGYAIFALDKNRLLTLYSAWMDHCC